VDQGLVGLAFAAGLVAALNPCGFAMLPAYLLLVVRGQQSGERSAATDTPGGSASANDPTGPINAVGRALAATVGMALGFLTVFGVFGALTISATSTVQRYLPYATVVIGVVLVCLGVWLLSGRELTALTPRPFDLRWAPNVRQRSWLVSMYGYGVSYAIASLSCTIGPFLAVTGAGFRAGFRGGSIVGGVAIYLAYVAGLTLVVGVLAIAAAMASSALADRLRRILPFVNRISGALLVLVGLYVGYYGFYELRLFSTTMSAHANPQDAVITAAGRLQGVLAGWVHQHGVWPWAVALVVLVVGAFASTWYRRVRR
jgi:cytochrome c biogenesis protein CcdA